MAIINNWSKNYGIINNAEYSKLHANLMIDLRKFVEDDPCPGSCKLLTARDCALILDFYEDFMLRQLLQLVHANLEGFVDIFNEGYDTSVDVSEFKEAAGND